MNSIREAAARVPGHWCKGSIGDGDGNYCGLGHLWEVAGFIEGQAIAKFMDEVATEQYPDRLGGRYAKGDITLRPFASFNDHPDTTENEVVAVMEKAAVKWDEQI